MFYAIFVNTALRGCGVLFVTDYIYTVQPLMWTQLHKYKVPCAGIALFTVQGINYTSLSTLTNNCIFSKGWMLETTSSV